MLTFLFWNIRHQPLYDVTAYLAHRHDADVVVVAECSEPATLIHALNAEDPLPLYHPADFQTEWVTVAVRFPPEYAAAVSAVQAAGEVREHTAVHALRRPVDPEPGVLLVATHLPSRLYRGSPEDRLVCHGQLAKLVLAVEAVVGHSRTVLVGDLNDDPYSSAVVHPNGLHAMMTRQLAAKPRASLHTPAFYNPMWTHMGERATGPPGSYYYQGAQGGRGVHYWHAFDQMLLRPAMMGLFRDDDLRILDQRDDPRLRLGRRPRSGASDHLPLLFSLQLP